MGSHVLRVARLLCTQRVVGSIPILSTIVIEPDGTASRLHRDMTRFDSEIDYQFYELMAE